MHFPILVIFAYAFNTEESAFSFPLQGFTLKWFALALGREDSARGAMERLRGYSADAELTLAAAGYEASLVLIDSLDAAAALPRLVAALEPLTREGAADSTQQWRAAFFLALMARRAASASAARTGNPRSIRSPA